MRPAPILPDDLRTLFLWRGRASAGDAAYIHLRDSLEPGESLSFGALVPQVLVLAARLSRRSAAGDRVLLAYKPGLDMVRAFWACIVSGRVAVPVPAPDPMRIKNSLPGLLAIVEDAEASLVMAQQELSDAAAGLPLADIPWWPTDGADEPDAAPLDTTAPAPEIASAPQAVAYLQYTSGSTSAPRGVTLTHANVLAQCEALSAACALHARGTRLLCWLPIITTSA